MPAGRSLGRPALLWAAPHCFGRLGVLGSHRTPGKSRQASVTIRTLSAIAVATLLQGAVPPAVAEDASGAYLAARQARYDHDFTAAAEYFTRALTQDQSNPAIMENAVVAHVALGDFDRALPIARKIESDELRSQVAHMVLLAEEVLQEDYDALMARLDAGKGVGQLADGLIAAWAHLGQGDMSQALELFDSVAGERGMRGFAIYHKALALASVGDFEGADQISPVTAMARCKGHAVAPWPGPKC